MYEYATTESFYSRWTLGCFCFLAIKYTVTMNYLSRFSLITLSNVRDLANLLLGLFLGILFVLLMQIIFLKIALKIFLFLMFRNIID